MKFGKLIVLFTSVSVLFGCSESKFVEEGKKNVNAGEAAVKEREKELEELEKKQKEIYEEMEKPLDEVIKDNELESKEVMEDNDIEIKETYEDNQEFGKLVGKILFDFQTLKMSPEEYLDFMTKYGSKNAKDEMLEKKEEQIAVYNSIQTIFKNQKVIRESYVLSKVTLTQTEKEGYFYRKISTDKGDEYFITTIVNEDGVWKFDQDQTSPPFIIEEVMIEEKGEQAE